MSPPSYYITAAAVIGHGVPVALAEREALAEDGEEES